MEGVWFVYVLVCVVAVGWPLECLCWAAWRSGVGVVVNAPLLPSATCTQPAYTPCTLPGAECELDERPAPASLPTTRTTSAHAPTTCSHPPTHPSTPVPGAEFEVDERGGGSRTGEQVLERLSFGDSSMRRTLANQGRCGGGSGGDDGWLDVRLGGCG